MAVAQPEVANSASFADSAGVRQGIRPGQDLVKVRGPTEGGRAQVRKFFKEVAQVLEEFKRFYQRKYKEVPKHQHKRALVLTARKLVRLIFSMLRKGRIYNPEAMNKPV